MLAMRPPVPGEPITPGPGRIQTHPCSATRVTASMGRGEAVSAVHCPSCSTSRRDFHIRSRCIWRRYRLTAGAKSHQVQLDGLAHGTLDLIPGGTGCDTTR